jgi:hypothetical protein
LGDETLPNLIKRKHPKKEGGEKTKTWGQGPKSRQSLADCLLAHNDAFVAGSTL